jgi:hypothetical protein
MNAIFQRGRCLLLCAVGLVGCGGGDDEETEGEKVCRAIAAKLDECNRQLPAGTRCNDQGDEEVLCVGRCFAEASCAEIASSSADTDYIRCVAACSGAQPGDFICASGTAYVPAAAVCDGVAQCPDESDEADCESGADAGAG